MSFFTFISIGFLIINLFIIFSDIKQKKIPNKYLLFLLSILWVYYIYLYVYWFQFSSYFFIQIIVSLIISFVLYYLWVWSAWDAKYLLVLTLFIPNTWIIPFIWNTAIITLVYLFSYFVYFYIRLLFSSWFRKKFMEFFLIDHRNLTWAFSWKGIRTMNVREGATRAFRQIGYFLLFFISIRLIRWDAIEYITAILTEHKNIINIGSYLLIIIMILNFVLMILYQRVKGFIMRLFISKKWKFFLKNSLVHIATPLFIFLGIAIYDYTRIGMEGLIHKIFIILTFYLIIYITIKILLYSYKIAFKHGEEENSHIDDLMEWVIVDKEYLIKSFWTQIVLWYGEGSKKRILYPNPTSYFTEIYNPIDKETAEKLKQIYTITNSFNTGNPPQTNIKILKTFAFWGYIFGWFLVTYIYGDGIMKMLISTCIELLQQAVMYYH